MTARPEPELSSTGRALMRRAARLQDDARTHRADAHDPELGSLSPLLKQIAELEWQLAGLLAALAEAYLQ